MVKTEHKPSNFFFLRKQSNYVRKKFRSGIKKKMVIRKN